MVKGTTVANKTPLGNIESPESMEIKKKTKKIKESKTIEKTVPEEIKETLSHGLYLGYRIVEDNGVNELRLPKDVIDFLANYADWSGIDKKFKTAEIVPDKFYVCYKDGYKRPKIKGTRASMFLCPRCHKPLH